MSFLLPNAVFEQHIILLGKTRSGKSSVMRLMVEHLLDLKQAVCVVDPKGDHWGLKASADGKKAGYPVVIFGGEHADVPLNARSGAAVAELAATGNRPCIVDLGGWMPGERTQFWIDFASTFFRSTKGRRWLVVDEVHNVAPKGKILDVNAGKMLHWSNRLASEGLGKGLSLICASQRPQKVHNDLLTSCETLIAMRVIHKADRDALKDWIDGCGDPEKGKEVLAGVASMARGEAWCWSPECGFGPEQIQFPMFSTYDSFRPRGTVPAKLAGWADVDLEEVKKKLQDAVKEAEANDPKLLHAKIRELQNELRKRQPSIAKATNAPDVRDIERAVAAESKRWQRTVKEYFSAFDRMRDTALRASEVLSKISEVKTPDVPPEVPLAPFSPPKNVSVHVPIPVERRGAPLPTVPSDNGEVHLREGARRMIAALCMWHPEAMSVDQMRSHAGLKKSGTFSAYCSDLRRYGLIEESGDMVRASERAIELFGKEHSAPSTTEEVLAIWRPKLRDGARRMLDALVEAAGEAVSKEELGAKAGLQKSGTFNAYLSDLRTARLAVVDGGMVAANRETLFL